MSKEKEVLAAPAKKPGLDLKKGDNVIATFLVITPKNPQFKGNRAGIKFSEGKGITTDPKSLDYFRSMPGYDIRELSEEEVENIHPFTEARTDQTAVEIADQAERNNRAKLAADEAEKLSATV